MSSEKTEHFNHELYTHVDNEKDADALAWAFVNKEKVAKFPFKFPPLGPNEIRANVLYVGLCHSDVFHARDLWHDTMPTTYPIVPGHEFVGEVSQVGENVKNFKKGDKVGFGTIRACCGNCSVCLTGDEQLCANCEDHLTYGKYFGGYATQVQQPADFFFKLPDGFKMNLGSPLFCAGITTFYPIQKYYRAGMKCAVVGIGGLGHLALKFLKKMGAHTSAFTTSEKKIQSLKELGADDVIVSTNPEEMKKVQKKFDLILYTIPGVDEFEKYFNTTAPKGYFVLLGVGEKNEVKFNHFPMLKNDIKLVGSLVGPRKAIREMVDFCTEKDVFPLCEEFDFEDLPKAFDKLENGKPYFRCVLNVKDFAEKNGWKK